MTRIAFILVALLLLTDTADARRFGRRSYSTSSNVGSSWTGAVGILAADQAACQRKAEYMARHGVLDHYAGGLPVIGNFEGIGAGGSGCATCRPGWSATLTGDASAVGNGGTTYRVRAWR